ncbi:MAG: helix-hairpin-helix domain-containing protein [Phycisphaeraceae bacterium]|nr:helix-hairpin-helix domain-containing protein [Phycisphaeraceae bacterium]
MKRGMILAAVMLLVALGALTSVGVLFRSSAEQFTVSATGRMGRSRAMARSGLAGVLREFEIQRMDILRGGQPILLDELSLEQPDGRTGVARIVRVRNRVATPEGAKINVNHTDEGTLGRLESVGPDLARRLMAGRPYAAIDDLLRVEGVTPEMLYGDLRTALADDPESEAWLIGDAEGGVALRDLLTVHGFWPVIQLGAGDNGSRYAGERKININREWSDDLGDAIRKRYSDEVANGVKAIMEQGVVFRSERDIINILNRIGVEPKDWAETLDSFCTSDEPALAGRVDVSRAPAEVLVALPGMFPEFAASIVSARETVDSDELTTVGWTVTSGAIDWRALATCIDSIAPSSAQWRVVIEAGFLPPGAEESDEDVALESRVVLEAVIDLSAPRARVAELTDITNLPLTIAWRLEGAEDREAVEERGGDESEFESDEPGPDTFEREAETERREDEPMDEADRESRNAAPASKPDRRIGRFRAGGGAG